MFRRSARQTSNDRTPLDVDHSVPAKARATPRRPRTVDSRSSRLGPRLYNPLGAFLRPWYTNLSYAVCGSIVRHFAQQNRVILHRVPNPPATFFCTTVARRFIPALHPGLRQPQTGDRMTRCPRTPRATRGVHGMYTHWIAEIGKIGNVYCALLLPDTRVPRSRGVSCTDAMGPEWLLHSVHDEATSAANNIIT